MAGINTKSIILMGLAAMGASTPALADPGVYLAPMLGYLNPDNKLSRTNDVWGGRLALGSVLSDRWNLEVGLASHEVGLPGGGHVNQKGFGMDGLYFFSRDPAFAPFGLLGLGYMRSDSPGDRDNAVTANLGLGFLKQINDRMDFRADLRYRLVDTDLIQVGTHRLDDWLIHLGLHVNLGKPAAPAILASGAAPVAESVPTTPIPPAPPSDSDGDGVIDSIDQCPATPPGRTVDARGCEFDSDRDGIVDGLDQCPGTPADRQVDAKGCEPDSDGDTVVDALDQCPGTPADRQVDAKGCEPDSDGDAVVDVLDQCPDTPTGRQVDAKGCEPDSDGDTVVDALDQCPNTPTGRQVDAKGCEPDSDGDAVVDALDQCPDTPKGDTVDEKGCTIASSIVLKGVTFESDKATLRPESARVLDEAAEAIQRYPHLSVEVVGHTDSTGGDAHNQALSEQRAQAVCDYFIQKGIEAQRLKATGYGASKPVADNKDRQGREENRRVELLLKPQ